MGCVPQREKTILPKKRRNKKGFSGGNCRIFRKIGQQQVQTDDA